MSDFDNRLNKDRNFNDFNNQNHDSYGGYNNYNNNSNYNNYNNYDNNSNYNNYNNYDNNSSYNNYNNYNYNNSYNNQSFYDNYNNSNNYYSNNTFENTYNNSNYINDYNKNLNNPGSFYKRKKKGNKKDIILTICVLGVIIAVVAFFAYLVIGISIGNVAFKNNVELIAPYMFLGFFGLLGLGLMIYPPINKYKKKKRCKYLVKATVVDFKRVEGDEGSTYSPIYEFYYRGNLYRVKEKSSRNFALPKLGEQVNMLINEENPYDFYVGSIASDLFFMVIGFMFLFVCVVFI